MWIICLNPGLYKRNRTQKGYIDFMIQRRYEDLKKKTKLELWCLKYRKEGVGSDWEKKSKRFVGC